MRTYTLIFSIVAHVLAACALLFTTVLATAELPTPRDGATFVNVVASPRSAPPPPARLRVEAPAAPETAPLEAPVGLHAEVERPLPIDAFNTAPTGGVVFGVGSDTGLVLRDEPPPPPPVASGPLRVGGIIKAPTKTVHVSPSYPAIARSARVSGVVILEATIAEDGSVRDVRILRSIPLLDQAAADAVRQWRFTPTLLNGQPVAVLMTVTVSFNLD